MIRLWLGAGLAIGLAAAGFFGYRSAFLAGHEAGSAVVQARWESDRAQAAAAATEALRASHAAYQAEVARREEVERGLQARLDAADARGRDLAGRLRAALAATGSCAMPGPGEPAGAVAGAGREPGDAGQVGAAVADHLAACERDAQRLTELQRWLQH